MSATATKSVGERVKNIINKSLGEGAAEYFFEVFSMSIEDALENFGIDQVDVAVIVLCLEDEFNIKIPDDDMSGIKTVPDMVTYIEGKINS